MTETEKTTKRFALDLSEVEWKAWLTSKQMPAYVSGQILEWIFNKFEIDPHAFSNLSKTLRQQLAAEFRWEPFTVDCNLVSKDTSEKFLLKTYDNQLIEMVIMPYDSRVTLCLSSQVGCRMGCTFCQTGKMGFKRNLSSGEIIAQIIVANRHLRDTGRDSRITNIVFMGMGEPLDNFEEVVKACQLMIDPRYFGLSKSRVTISTSGIVPMIRELGKVLPVRLAISLHTAHDDKRSEMMPINRKYSLQDLKEALLEYPAPNRHGITFEYVMIFGVNDSIADAKKLVAYLHGLKAKVNLIPLNHFPGNAMEASSEASLQEFQRYLSERSIPAPIRYSRGQDISGGCGQLAAKKEDELHLDPRDLHREKRKAALSSKLNII